MNNSQLHPMVRFLLGHSVAGNNASIIRANRDNIRRAWKRWAVIILAVIILWGYEQERMLTEISLVVFALICIVILLKWRVHPTVSKLKVRSTRLPLAETLAEVLCDTAQHVRQGLTLAPNPRKIPDGGTIALLVLPDFFEGTDEQKARVEAIFASRIGIEQRYQWNMTKVPMTLVVKRKPQPPKRVKFADVHDLLAKLRKDEVLVGLNAERKEYVADLDKEDPHWIICAGPGGGKTSLQISIAMQALNHGAERIDCVDVKRVSYEPLAGIPGVRIYNNPQNMQEMWDGIKDFRRFLEKRIEDYDKDRTIQFERAMLFISELNTFSLKSRLYWDSIRANGDLLEELGYGKARGKRAMPPVWDDIAEVACMGRQFKFNLVLEGQDVKDSVIGGLRNVFGYRWIARFTPQQYGYFIGVLPAKLSSDVPGRWLGGTVGKADWVQTIKPDDPDGDFRVIRDYAMAGRRQTKSVDMNVSA